ncbi:LysM peptidoglycan-binding domain-containing protein [Pseudonocardia zijingensis]|uniref:LysM peptidoglycan-binding domain-containing protein n=3 Tax=Pseudonocardia zijingensis TaxID=153376 RepID=UPI003606F68B
MNEPDHERLRRDLETAASEARTQSGGPRFTGRQALIGALAAVPVAAAVIAAIAASQSSSQPSGPNAQPAAPTTPVGEPPAEAAVPAPPPRPSTPRAPATSTGPDVPPRAAEPEPPRTDPPRTDPPSADPSRPEPARPAPPEAGRPATHTVQPGETLARIALRYQVPLERIAEQNGIADPDVIRAGATLEIRPAPQNEVVIPEGATLTGLASRHGVTVSHLLRLNPHIMDADRIVAGGRLRIS